jgi:hypothetical protein
LCEQKSPQRDFWSSGGGSLAAEGLLAGESLLGRGCRKSVKVLR